MTQKIVDQHSATPAVSRNHYRQRLRRFSYRPVNAQKAVQAEQGQDLIVVYDQFAGPAGVSNALGPRAERPFDRKHWKQVLLGSDPNGHNVSNRQSQRKRNGERGALSGLGGDFHPAVQRRYVPLDHVHPSTDNPDKPFRNPPETTLKIPGRHQTPCSSGLSPAKLQTSLFPTEPGDHRD